MSGGGGGARAKVQAGNDPSRLRAEKERGFGYARAAKYGKCSLARDPLMNNKSSGPASTRRPGPGNTLLPGRIVHENDVSVGADDDGLLMYLFVWRRRKVSRRPAGQRTRTTLGCQSGRDVIKTIFHVFSAALYAAPAASAALYVARRVKWNGRKITLSKHSAEQINLHHHQPSSLAIISNRQQQH